MLHFNSIVSFSVICTDNPSMIILSKSILAEIDNFSNGHKMHDTVMLVLDDKYVVTEEAIEGMKFTIPENYIWCLTHMTTSGKERFTIVMSMVS